VEKTMRALFLKGRGDMAMAELPVPKPKGGEVLVKVHSCGICHTDVNSRTGFNVRERYGFVPGHEFTGTIVECGDGVRCRRVGERGVIHQIIPCGVCRPCTMSLPVQCESYTEMGNGIDGGFADYCVMPEVCFFPLPDSVSFEQGTLVEPLANATWAVHSASINPGDTVVVIGPGPIGIMAAKMASLMQPERVILVGTRDKRLQIGRRYGATDIVNIRNEDAEDYLLNGLLGGKGADAVIDASGSLDGLKTAFKLAKRGSRICLEGSIAPGETLSFVPSAFPANASIKKLSAWRTHDFLNSIGTIAARRIDPDPLITHVLPFDEWEKGFDLATFGKDEAIKVVLNME